MDSVYTLVFVYTFYRIQRLVWCIVNRIVLSYAYAIRVRAKGYPAVTCTRSNPCALTATARKFRKGRKGHGRRCNVERALYKTLYYKYIKT